MKRLLSLAIIIALAATIVIAGMTAPRTSMADPQTTRKAVAVDAGTVSASIKATGNLEPHRTSSIGFQSEGKVSAVYVVQGQTVVTGTKLAMLETTSFQTSVKQAQISLDKAKAELAVTKAKATADEIASAKAALSSAQAAYNILVAGPSKDEVTSATSALRQAEVAVQQAQTDYDKIAWQGGAGATSQAVELQNATLAYQKALADYNVAQAPPTDDEVQKAKASIASAQNDLNKLLRGATDEEIAISQIAIDSAQVSLENAQQDLEGATLTAPFAGTIVSVGIDAGVWSGSTTNSTGVIDLYDLSALHVVVPVDEIDLPSVKVGQSAIVTLDALPTTPLKGKVTLISPAPTSTDSDSATTYEVNVTLDEQTEGVYTGMTAKVEIQTESRAGVPVIPTSVVQTDKTTGETYVDKVGPDGQAVRTVVTLGLRSGTNIEVKSGLQVGDQVLEPVATQPAAAATTTTQQGGMFGGPGMGGPPPGGGGPPPGAGAGGGSSRSSGSGSR